MMRKLCQKGAPMEAPNRPKWPKGAKGEPKGANENQKDKGHQKEH